MKEGREMTLRRAKSSKFIHTGGRMEGSRRRRRNSSVARERVHGLVSPEYGWSPLSHTARARTHAHARVRPVEFFPACASPLPLSFFVFSFPCHSFAFPLLSFDRWQSVMYLPTSTTVLRAWWSRERAHATPKSQSDADETITTGLRSPVSRARLGETDKICYEADNVANWRGRVRQMAMHVPL